MGLLGRTRSIAPALGRDINAVHIHERLRKGLGIQGGNPVSTLGDELVPVVIVDDLHRVDQAPGAVRKYFAACLTGVPVNNAQLIVYNPPNSQTFVKLDWFMIDAVAAPAAFWGIRVIGNANLGAALAAVSYTPLDPLAPTSGPGNNPGSALFTYNDVAAVPSQNGYFQFAQGGSLPPFPLSITLGPDEQIRFTKLTTAASIGATILVTEYARQP